MNLRTVIRLIGVLLGFIGLSMSFPLFWSLYLDGPDAGALGTSMAVCIGFGGVLFAVGWGSSAPVLRRESLAIVGGGWLLAAFFGALPFYLSGAIPSFIDAYFESMSGFTTTGSTILLDIEAMPRGLLFWRSFTHWLGGMGIVVLFVAVLPYLRAGGKQLFQSEVPGPAQDTLKPRIQETASFLWKVYVGLSAVLTALLYLQGMSFYDALCHTFGTMATGGFSTQNASVGAYDSWTIDLTLIVFMILAATNFGLYFHVIRGRLNSLLRDPEWRFFVGLVGLCILLVSANLYHRNYDSVWGSLRYGSFQVVSIVTTTGFGTADFDVWPAFSVLILVSLMFVGGCAGSTGGGMKAIRFLILLKNAAHGVERVFRPHIVRTMKLGGEPVEDDLRDAIVVYFSLLMLLFLFSSLAMAAMGLDLLTAVTSVATTLNNIGPGLNAVGPIRNFAGIPDAGKLLLSICMLLGRLELFAVLVLFMPSFWQGR